MIFDRRNPLNRLNRLRIKRSTRNRRDTKTDSRVNHDLIAELVATSRDDPSELKSFLLRLEGHALAPDFQDGDILTVAPDVLPVPGDCVVALIRGRYGCMRMNADGDLWDGNGRFVAQGFYSVAGVVLERMPATETTENP